MLVDVRLSEPSLTTRPSTMTYASVGCRLPLDGFTRSDHREPEVGSSFHAESANSGAELSWLGGLTLW